MSSSLSEEGRARFSAMDLDEVRALVATFASERDWDQFHTVRNIMLALVGEVGELAECFQWRGDDSVPVGLGSFSAKEKEHVGEELADVMLYLARLSELCGIDLSQAVKDKMQKNRNKYPPELCRGSAKKYTHYQAEVSKRKRVSGENDAADDDNNEGNGGEDPDVRGANINDIPL